MYTSYVGMNAFIAEGAGYISYSKDNVTWTDKAYTTPEWKQDNLSAFLTDNATHTIYIKFSDSTTADGNGIQIKMLSFVRSGILNQSNAAGAASLTNGIWDSFTVSGEVTQDSHYIHDNGGWSDGGKFRFYDGLDKNDMTIKGYIGGGIGVYKFTYTDKAAGLKLRAKVAGNYILSVAKSVPMSGAEVDTVEIFNNSNWTDVAVGAIVATPVATDIFIDLSALMANNTDKTIYIRIGDATDVKQDGGWLFDAALIEQEKIAAPTFTMPSGTEIENITVDSLGEIDLSQYKIVSKDAALVAYIASVKAPGTEIFVATMGNKFTPTAVGTYFIKLTATDANGTVGTKEFNVIVEAKLSGIEIEVKPTKTVYEKGEELSVLGGKIKLTYSDSTTKSVDIVAGMISGYDKTKTGEQTITVTYEGKTTTFTITVNEP